ncbi:MAG: hypothetical protein KF752_12155 [Pirellulaceae bacterium]|nr:hypothetical protein [Pirellulaceae bacterium]
MTPTTSNAGRSRFLGYLGSLGEPLIYLTLAMVLVGSPTPGVNESHYLPKAKHAWNATFANGGDLFLESGDSHFLTTTVAGLAARLWELPTVAWAGRCVAWGLMGLAWMRLGCVCGVAGAIRPLAFSLWFLLVHYGNWAGEWFLGGFEAKAIAYPLVLLGLAAAIQGRWHWAWLWLGSAVAWHPVVGGWAGVTVAGLWLTEPHRFVRVREQWIALATAAAIGLLGALPALQGLGGSGQQDQISAPQVHVFFRLAHHLLPRSFAMERHMAAGAVLAALITATWWILTRRAQWRERPVSKLMIIAWLSVLISLIGGLIDLAIQLGLRQDMAARLLRFYWFRWSDVAVPLALALVAGNWLTNISYTGSYWNLKDISPAGRRCMPLAIVVVCGLVTLHWARFTAPAVPPADLLLIQSPGPHSVSWDDEVDDQAENDRWEAGALLTRRSTSNDQWRRHRDWLAVCDWIAQHTPTDSLWLTPKYQQTFKWYAGRAEVVSWKDVPQDNDSIIEWYRRIEACKPPRDASGALRGWTTEELLKLARQYGFRWVLVDRTYQPEPPLLECKYPLLIDNRSFAVLVISDSALAVSP